MDKNERRICWYSSLLIALVVNTPKLLALRTDGIVAHYWHFNLAELIFQWGFNLLFCLLVFYINLRPPFFFSGYRLKKQRVSYWSINGAIFFLSVPTGALLQRGLFPGDRLPGIYFLGTFARLGLSIFFALILLRIIFLLRATKKQELENEQLKSAYMATELELLKEQINPHFLFNSLSSLSGVIRENPELAQKYVRDLSNVFRYALTKTKVNLVTLDEELQVLKSFAELITMRLENAFQLSININTAKLTRQLPHLSLQPLLENAVKHNSATINRPLKVELCDEGEWLLVKNSLAEVPVAENSTGLGLLNLNERCKLMLNSEIEITKTTTEFIVKLTLKK
jgi:hypothetical protein